MELRLLRRVSSRRWNSGSWKVISACTRPHEDQAAALGNVVEGRHHGVGIPGCVEYRGGQFSAEEFLHLPAAFFLPVNTAVYSETFEAELQSAVVDFHDHHPGAGDLGELDYGKADGAGTDDEDGFSLVQGSALNRMGADAKGLHQSQLVQGEQGRGMQFLSRYHYQLPHSTVHVYAQHP